MAIHTLANNVLPVVSSVAALSASPATPPAIDTLGYRHALVVATALPTGAGSQADVSVTESATAGGTYTAIPGANTANPASGTYTLMNGTVVNVTTGYFTTAGGIDYLLIDIDLAKRLRFLRVTITGAGGVLAGSGAALVLLYEPWNLGTATAAKAIKI